jgi:hypothetical protein
MKGIRRPPAVANLLRSALLEGRAPDFLEAFPDRLAGLTLVEVNAGVKKGLQVTRSPRLLLRQKVLVFPASAVIPPFLVGFWRRIHAASCSFWAGVIPPRPMFGRSWL